MSESKPTLHHMNNSQSQRILWLLEELQIPYNLVHHFRQPNLFAPPALKQIHPLGKSPLLVTASNTVISESSAIITYLLITYDNPPSSPKFNFNPRNLSDESAVEKYIKDEELVSFAGTTMGNIWFIQLIFEMARNKTPWFLRWIPNLILGGIKKGFTEPARKKQLEYLEMELGDKEWFSGAQMPGRADFVLSFPFDVLAQRGWVDFDKEYPKLGAWRERILVRDAWKSALMKGNGYDFTVF